MSLRPRYAQLAAKALQRDPSGEAGDAFGDARARRIEAIGGAIRRRAARKKLLRRAVAGLAVVAAAAAAVLMVGARRADGDALAERQSGNVYVERGSVRQPFTSGAHIRTGDHLVAGEGASVELALPTGTHIELGPRADLSVVSQDRNQVYWLAAGTLQAHVAKLKDGQRFIVRTVDSEVEVRGTRFRVIASPEALCAEGTHTRVEVTEGVVTVRHAGTEARVLAGQQWPASCQPLAASPSAAPPSTLLPAASPPFTAAAPVATPSAGIRPTASATTTQVPPSLATAPITRREARTPAAEEPTRSELAAQNDLFARATDQKREGNYGAAVATFEQFLTRYPRSALAESAAVERLRLLGKLDPTGAAAAAKDYLVHYPNGFARVEASALAAPRQ